MATAKSCANKNIRSAVSIPASIFHKSIAVRYRSVSYPDGRITARYRFIKNAYWDSFSVRLLYCIVESPKKKHNKIAISAGTIFFLLVIATTNKRPPVSYSLCQFWITLTVLLRCRKTFVGFKEKLEMLSYMYSNQRLRSDSSSSVSDQNHNCLSA